MDENSSELPREPHALHILTVRTHLDEVQLLNRGDVYVVRGCKERSLKPSFWANRYKVARHGRKRCLALYKQEVQDDP